MKTECKMNECPQCNCGLWFLMYSFAAMQQWWQSRNTDNTRLTFSNSPNEAKRGWKGNERCHSPGSNWTDLVDLSLKRGGKCSCWQTTGDDWSQGAGLAMFLPSFLLAYISSVPRSGPHLLWKWQTAWMIKKLFKAAYSRAKMSYFKLNQTNKQYCIPSNIHTQLNIECFRPVFESCFGFIQQDGLVVHVPFPQLDKYDDVVWSGLFCMDRQAKEKLCWNHFLGYRFFLLYSCSQPHWWQGWRELGSMPVRSQILLYNLVKQPFH